VIAVTFAGAAPRDALIRPPDHQNENRQRARGGEDVRCKRGAVAEQGSDRGIGKGIGGLAFGEEPRSLRLAPPDRAEQPGDRQQGRGERDPVVAQAAAGLLDQPQTGDEDEQRARADDGNECGGG
jgi:hypothetical protein